MFVLKCINTRIVAVIVCKLYSGKFQKVFLSFQVRNNNEMDFYTKTIFCNKSNIKLFEKIISTDSLIIAFKQLKSYLKIFFFTSILRFIGKVSRGWFDNLN